MPEAEERTSVLHRLVGRQRLSSADKEELAAGRVRLGQYRITGKLGRGGMGSVLAAQDETLGREVALKVLPPDAKDLFRARFQREAQALARLDHPNIVRVHAFEHIDDLSFLALERVHGKSLEGRINHEGTLPEDDVWQLIRHTVRAMAAAEAQGILHRDLKPGNILWVSELSVYKICDFGLARFQGGEAEGLTVEGTTMGTPFYMSPEQVRGQDLDPRSDMYSLGMTIHEATTGEIPFQDGAIGAVLVRRLETDVPSLRESCPNASAALVELVDSLTRRNPKDRPASWAALDGQLDASSAGTVVPGQTRDFAPVPGPGDPPTTRTTPPEQAEEDGAQTLREPALGEILGNYELQEVLGRGGMGVIYKALNRKNNKTYALKALIVGEGPDGERRRERFRTEVEALRRLRHDHIVTVYTYGRSDIYDWYAMDFVDGVELKELLEDPGALTHYDKLTLFVQVCKAIAHAHSRNVVHRDLKPANVLVSTHSKGKERRAHVLDFGLAKLADEGKMGLTRTGAFLGTPYYMAPEQFLDPKGVDKRTDIFALGVILFEMMVGQRPFGGQTAGEVSFKIMRQDAPRPTKLNPKLHKSFDAICKKALARDPERRYQDADKLKKDVIKFRRGTAKTETLGDRFKGWLGRWFRAHKVGFFGGLFVATLLYVPVILIIWWLYGPS